MRTNAVTMPLVLSDVSLRAGNKRVIKDLSCRFTKRPSCSVIIGPNGAGKSMLLKLCHGLVAPDAGRITWAGGSDPGRRGQYQAMVLQRRLSVGEQQRLALARAWAVRPELLLLDEPSANLDPAATHLIEEIIQEAAEQGSKIVMTTHDLNQARRLADEVLFLHRGRLKEQAAAADFFAGPRNDLAQAFLRGELLWWRRRSIYTPDDNRKDS